MPEARDSYGFGTDVYPLLHFKQITNKDLLYSTWSSAQCYVAVWMGGGSGENGYTHMYGWVPFHPPETTTTLLIGYTPIQNKKVKVWGKKEIFYET